MEAKYLYISDNVKEEMGGRGRKIEIEEERLAVSNDEVKGEIWRVEECAESFFITYRC